MELDLAVDMDLYLVGDLLQSAAPPDVPGVQPCPLCVRQCATGTNDRFPCADDSDCPGGGTCGAATQCLGGTNDSDPCLPGTSDLGDGFPTSRDCLLHPDLFLVGLPFDLTLSTGAGVANAMSDPDPVPEFTAVRVFCGFCRDRKGFGSGRFEGDPDGPAGGSAAPVACDTDADCNDGDEYESCEQKVPGGLGSTVANQIAVTGSAPDECLADGMPHAANLASTFCLPPDPPGPSLFSVESLYTLPGPGALTVQGAITLVP